ncbi:MAG: type II toxin-antitoxin system death-on-curing family toxin [Thermomicrobiales bacterium]
MKGIRYPSLAEVVAIHDEILRRLGSTPQGLRDEGALESAIMRPQMAAWYEGADLIRQAALLAAGISQAQAFIDGNKRTAFQTLDAFLWVNGWAYVAEPLALAQQLEQIADPFQDRASMIDAFEAWLRERVEPRSPRS